MLTIHRAPYVSGGNCDERFMRRNPCPKTVNPSTRGFPRYLFRWSAERLEDWLIKCLTKGTSFERISWRMTSDSNASRLVRFEAFAALQAVGLHQVLIDRPRLLALPQAADRTGSPAQLKVGGLPLRRN